MSEAIHISVTPAEQVSAIAYPATSRSTAHPRLILAHGAGGGQASPFMVQFATALAARGIATLTFNFLYSEAGRRLPDRNDKLEACYRAVIRAVRDGAFDKSLGGGGGPLIIGGKSMGGRIASQVAAASGPGSEADAVAGLLFLGYPLHPPGRPEVPRTKHLPAIRSPLLFVQGERDAFGTPEELRPVLKGLKAPADLCVIAGGDHSWKVPKSAGRSQAEVFDFALDAIEAWLAKRVFGPAGRRGA